MDASLTSIYSEEIKLTDKNKRLVELTTATGYHDADLGRVPRVETRFSTLPACLAKKPDAYYEWNSHCLGMKSSLFTER